METRKAVSSTHQLVWDSLGPIPSAQWMMARLPAFPSPKRVMFSFSTAILVYIHWDTPVWDAFAYLSSLSRASVRWENHVRRAAKIRTMGDAVQLTDAPNL